MKPRHSPLLLLTWNPLVVALPFGYMVYRTWSGRTGLVVWAGLAVIGLWFAISVYDRLSGHRWLDLTRDEPVHEEGAGKDFDERAAPDYASTDAWEHASPMQAKRAARSFRVLARRSVPVYPGPLFIDDESTAKVQPADEVARRVLILWAVQLRADGTDQSEALGLIAQLDLWPSVSPAEAAFLSNENPSPDECRELVWRLESIWVLMWALGYIDEFDWPSGMCDVPKLARLITPYENDAAFITSAQLRPTSELLDAQDLVMRIHWAIRDAYLNHGGMIPGDLDWSNQSERVSVSQSAAVGVVEQRHYALNWLVNSEPADWDDVDTPT